MNKVAALGVIVILGIFIQMALHDSNPGKGAFPEKSSSLVADSYLTKSVSQKAPAEISPGDTKLENGAANVVTSVVVDYRGFDTLGEVTILFAVAAGIGLFLKKRPHFKPRQPGTILKTLVPLAVFFIFITGSYVFLHGHLTPGGGFPGGAMMAAGVVLLALSIRKSMRSVFFKILESLAGISFVAIGLIGLYTKGSFLQNFLGAGALGNLYSAWLVMILYFIIGIKVAAELSSVIADFDQMEEGGKQ
ncbi:MAG: cation:proton antiporter [Deltaproteobacteria bacterium]|jgi:multicomponent Na+:H+ antiporter subunit B|nr:cation:proton antiporter [Deltaproteobacteria bacterium]